MIGRIVPDEEMPASADGTPVELLFNFLAMPTRLNFGQVREALLSRIARAEGEPAIVPPFQAPDEAELRRRLANAGLRADGMETLHAGSDGAPLPYPSMVGWVYWGRTVHIVEDKIHTGILPEEGCQMQGELEAYTLRDLGAFENLRETFNLRAAKRDDAGTLAARAAAGAVEQAPPPTPAFAEVVRRLEAAGIRAELQEEGIAFHFAPPAGEALRLAAPLPHPWRRECTLAARSGCSASCRNSRDWR